VTRIASHRGGTLEFGDSTPQGFAATARMALEEVEFDVHPTRDGQIVVHHDATLDRTTDTTGVIADLSASQVCSARIDYGQGGHPLLLEQLCAQYADSTVAFRCEFKPGHDGLPYPGLVPKVIGLLRANDRLRTTVFSSFLIANLDEIGASCDQPRLWLVSPPVLHQLGLVVCIDIACRHGIPELGFHIDNASPRDMEQVRAAGLDYGCWAAHSREQIEKALTMGVKVFTTDRPSLAIAARQQFHERTGTGRAFAETRP
jgi:glycerophosphoryl diester phosphodiesterase